VGRRESIVGEIASGSLFARDLFPSTGQITEHDRILPTSGVRDGEVEIGHQSAFERRLK
jgi:hypothetical protein